MEKQHRFSLDGFLETLSGRGGQYNVLDSLLFKQEMMIRDKCHVKWQHWGDHNTAFFHSLLRVRKSQRALLILEVDGSLVSYPSAIKYHVIDFYKKNLWILAKD